MTLNQIITQIKSFQQNHKQLKSLFAGLITDYDVNKSQDYPVLIVTWLPSTISDGRENFSFTIGVFDKMNLDFSNEIEILSDTRLIAKDFLAFIKTNPDFKTLSLDLPIELNPQVEKFDDGATGVFFDVNIYQPEFLDYCTIPSTAVTPDINNGVEIVDQDGNVLATLYPGQQYSVTVIQSILQTLVKPPPATIIQTIT